MRRRNRNLEIFSLSAIDLFASALGAFIIVTAILIPYYPNMKDGGATLARMESLIGENRLQQAEAEETLQATHEAIAQKKGAAERAAAARAAREALRKEAAALAAGNDQLGQQLARLEGELAALAAVEAPAPEPEPEAEAFSDFSVLGITTQAKKIVLTVDLSGSMRKTPAITQSLVDTLLEIIEPFHEGIQFAIIGFQGAGVTQYWPRRGRMAIADAKSKADARHFIRQIPQVLNGSTPTKTALLRALQYKPEAIILISDGEPTDDEGAAIVARITELNRKRVEINTVAVGKYLERDQLVRFLNQLANNNGGQFVGVFSE